MMPIRWALQILTQQKKAIECAVQALEPERLNRRGGESTWSVLEIVDHLRKVEEGFADGMAASGNLSVNVRRTESVRAFLLVGFMLLPTKVKIPAGAPVHPDAELDVTRVVSSWNETRSGLLRTISQLQNGKVSGGVIRHPVSGWMGLTAATWFLAAHMIHHRYQLRRVLKSEM